MLNSNDQGSRKVNPYIYTNKLGDNSNLEICHYVNLETNRLIGRSSSWILVPKSAMQEIIQWRRQGFWVLMFVCACMYVYTYVCVLCVYVGMCVCACMYICIYVCMCAMCVCRYVCACMYVCMYVCIYVCMCAMCVCRYVCACMYIRMYVCYVCM